jgi:hypothetical protein
MALTLDGTTGISATGNIYGNNIIVSNTLTIGSFSPAVISTVGNVTGGNILTGGLISATSTIISAANITGSNILTGGTISATANVTGGNILTGGIVSATGNITGSYILGNGSQLTGIDATSIQNGTSNAKVVSSGGNVSVSVGGTSNVAVFATTGEYITGVVSASGNVTGGNLLGTNITGTLTTAAQGNITSVGTLTSLAVTGNIVSSANIIAMSGTVVADNIKNQGGTGIYLAPGPAGYINFFTSAGDRVSITDAGALTALSNITGGNLLSNAAVLGSTVSATGNVTGGNLLTGGLISATGNVTGGNVNAGNITIAADLISSLGATLTIDPATVGNTGLVIINGNLQVNGTTTTINSNVVSTNDLTVNYANNAVNSAAANGGGIEVGPIGSPYITWLYNNSANVWTSSAGVSAVGDITGGNIATGGLISATANVTGGNVLTGGLISATGAITGAAITGSSLTVLTGTITGGNIVNGNGNGIGNIGSSTVYFNTGFLKATTAQYADLAELYVADAIYTPGTVLDFGGANEVTLSSVASSARIAGVVSTNPAHLMNSMLQNNTALPIALQGRVPTSVTGTVRKGDMMVSAGNGFAQACSAPSMGTVIGKALADFDGVYGTIEIVVGRL